jgi:hypothetical protein
MYSCVRMRMYISCMLRNLPAEINYSFDPIRICKYITCTQSTPQKRSHTYIQIHNIHPCNAHMLHSVQNPHTHIITPQSRSHYSTVTVTLLHSHGHITPQSQSHYSTVTVTLLHSHGHITPQSRSHYSTVTVTLLHSHGHITPQSQSHYSTVTVTFPLCALASSGGSS